MVNPAVIFRLGLRRAVLAAAPNRQPRRPPRRGASPVRRTLFHAPSFSAGVVMGAVVVLGAAYLPEMMGGPDRDPVPAAADARPNLTFEFDHLLRTSEVAANPEPYASAPRERRTPEPANPAATAGPPQSPGLAADPQPFQPAPDDAAPPGRDLALALAPPPVPAFAPEPPPIQTPAATDAATFMLQAASFRSREDADRLRASLLLLDLPASTTISSLPSGVWYRVTVGPFTDRSQAEQALSRLQEHNISAIWTRS